MMDLKCDGDGGGDRDLGRWVKRELQQKCILSGFEGERGRWGGWRGRDG